MTGQVSTALKDHGKYYALQHAEVRSHTQPNFDTTFKFTVPVARIFTMDDSNPNYTL